MKKELNRKYLKFTTMMRLVLIWMVIFPLGIIKCYGSWDNIEPYSSIIESDKIILNTPYELTDGRYAQMKADGGTQKWKNEFQNVSVKNIVELRLNDDKLKKYGNFTLQMHVVVETFNELGVSIANSGDQILEINYTDGSTSSNLYTDKSVYTTTGGYRMLLTVTSISPTPQNFQLDDDIVLEQRIEVERYYYFSGTVGSNLQSSFIDNNELQISWDFYKGSVYYELEWVFVSQYISVPGTKYVDQVAKMDAALDWKNATRVRTGNTNYKIPLVYDEGKLYYRVRGVGKNTQDINKWSPSSWSNRGEILITTPYEKGKNWAYQASYVADGKRADGMGFYDGTSRLRQEVANNSEDEVVMVSESFYDYDGRPVVNALPGVVPDGKLGFYKGFTIAQDPTTKVYSNYGKENFATDSKIVNPDPIASKKNDIDADSYYNNYFSKDNPMLHEGAEEYVADAQGYGFVQSVFDARGRLKKQSGVGIDHKTGSGHEVEVNYGTPKQEQLDRLFGNSVGYSKYYSMSIVKDPNGQETINYYDLSGRLIASGVAGLVPQENGTNMVEQLPTYRSDDLTSSLIDGNHYSAADNSITVTNIFTNTTTGVHNFSYTLQGAMFEKLCGSQTPGHGQTDTCKYIIEITVKRDGVTLYKTPINVGVHNKTISFAVNFDQLSTYVIEKRLMLDESALETAKAGYQTYLESTDGAACLPTIASRIQTIKNSIDYSGCQSCQEHATLQARKKWSCTAGTTSDCTDDVATLPVPTSAQTLDDYIQSIVKLSCSTLSGNGCDGLKATLIEDMSPGGQYFDNRKPTDPYSQAANNQWLSAHVHADGSSSWFNDNFQLRTTDVIINNWTDVRNNWNDGFAEFLLPYHPEYCSYQWCQTTSSSQIYDLQMRSTNTLCEAIKNNYLNNGVGNCTLASSHIPELAAVTNDPLRTVATTPSNLFSDFSTTFNQAKLDAYWDKAILKAPDYDLVWTTYRELYLNDKNSYLNSKKQTICPDIADPNAKKIGNLTNVSVTNYTGILSVGGFSVRSLTSIDFSSIGTPASTNTNPANWVDAQKTTIQGIQGNDKLCNYNAGACFDLNYYWMLNKDIIHAGGVPEALYIEVLGKCNPVQRAVLLEGFVVPTYNRIPAYTFANFVAEVHLNILLNLNQGFYNHKYTCSSDGVTGKICVEIKQGEEDHYCGEEYLEMSTNLYNNDNYKAVFGFIPLGGVPDADLIASNPTSGPTIFAKRRLQQCYKTKDDACECKNLLNVLETVNDENMPPYLANPANASYHWISNPPYSNLFFENMASMATYYNSTYSSFSYFANDNLSGGYTKSPLTVTSGNFYNYVANCLVSGKPTKDWDTQKHGTAGLNYQAFPIELICSEPTEMCDQWANEYATQKATDDYNEEKKQLLQDFEDQYRQKCFSQAALDVKDVTETLTVSYNTKEYQFTLYYYDQVGNLIKTISPGGFELLTVTQIADVQKYRAHDPTVPNPIFPPHRIPTKLEYNTLGDIIASISPDAGTSTYIYDGVGRMILAQNEKQATQIIPTYSYSKYDPLGRTIESGEIRNSTVVTNAIKDQTKTDYQTWLNAGTKIEVTVMQYDVPINDVTVVAEFGLNGQQRTRNRISSVFYYEQYSSAALYSSAMHYGYNEHGLVDRYVSDAKDPFQGITNGGVSHQRFKHIDYDYELFGGIVNKITFQAGKEDQFIHRYEYDKNNRLRRVFTSKDGILWDQDAKYMFYAHGPMSRIEVGDKQVQGVDFAYTIQGWLKGVNSGTLDASRDIGQDGMNAGLAVSDKHGNNRSFGRDAYGFTLGYFKGDYKTLSPYISNDNHFDPIATSGSAVDNAWGNLYNGNITKMTSAINIHQGSSTVPIVSPQTTLYRYDQLNRLKEATAYQSSDVISSNNWSNAAYSGATKESSNYYERFDYDANGNILKLKRNAFGVISNAMDDFDYTYSWSNPGDAMNDRKLDANNRLYHVKDNVLSDPAFTDDIKNTVDNSQGGTDNYYDNASGNKRTDGGTDDYQYDKIGNLTTNRNEEIKTIEWTASRKVKRITRYSWSAKEDLELIYDAFGRRIAKIVKPKNAAWVYTAYSLDASGMVMATYNYTFNPSTNVFVSATLIEHDIYGATRLGVVNSNKVLTGTNMVVTSLHRELGNKSYELPNHLGSVMTVVSDRKIAFTELAATQTIKSGYEEADNSLFRERDLIQDKIIYSQDFEDGLMEGFYANEATFGISTFYNSNKQLGVQTNTQFGQVSRAYDVEKGKNYTFSWDYSHGLSLLHSPDSYELRDGTTGNLIAGGGGDMSDGHIQFSINLNVSSVRLVFFRNETTASGYKAFLIDNLTVKTTETIVIAYEEEIEDGAGKGIAGSSAVALNAATMQYGPELLIPVQVGFHLSSAKVQAKINPDVQPAGYPSGFTGAGSLYADYVLEDNTSIYIDNHGGSTFWLSSADATSSTNYTELSITGLLPLPATVYDIHGNPIDPTKKQVYLRVAPWVSDIHKANTLFDNLEVAFTKQSGDVDGKVVYYRADIQQSSDYYAFGSPMSGREIKGNYRYGYQGSEKDNEIVGAGNSYTTEFRQLDPRLGRWFSVDAVFQPWQSPYTSMDNTPISHNDVAGLKAKNNSLDAKKERERNKHEGGDDPRPDKKGGGTGGDKKGGGKSGKGGDDITPPSKRKNIHYGDNIDRVNTLISRIFDRCFRQQYRAWKEDKSRDYYIGRSKDVTNPTVRTAIPEDAFEGDIAIRYNPGGITGPGGGDHDSPPPYEFHWPKINFSGYKWERRQKTVAIPIEYTYRKGEQSHYEKVRLRSRVPGTVITLYAENVPDEFTITDKTNNVVVLPPTLLGNPAQYNGVTSNTLVLTPMTSGKLIVEVNSLHSNDNKGDASEQGFTKFKISYRKYYGLPKLVKK